ncbi:exported hypothetical protein [Cupriavidus necator]|uniref:Uncharacterized protein n=1 Tax=Cupriavidus necator TaxID=106590 RepID=A0A1K0ILR7_CUPNE|nr:exported hypothetical protein [Cupriavidus necator]
MLAEPRLAVAAASGMGSVFFAMFFVADQQLSHFFTAAARLACRCEQAVPPW